MKWTKILSQWSIIEDSYCIGVSSLMCELGRKGGGRRAGRCLRRPAQRLGPRAVSCPGRGSGQAVHRKRCDTLRGSVSGPRRPLAAAALAVHRLLSSRLLMNFALLFIARTFPAQF